eukprot:TRINITY_DN16787_c0_g1_i1.p2 TRINITY_DN16787_c0_g1~~TRINITY_DN16787_c0_g1_i1.p2  ORF type:complete len:122 (-),score=16.05 TRINITY_DN16787_c0_g1_i1:211-525(-)
MFTHIGRTSIRDPSKKFTEDEIQQKLKTEEEGRALSAQYVCHLRILLNSLNWKSRINDTLVLNVSCLHDIVKQFRLIRSKSLPSMDDLVEEKLDRTKDNTIKEE